jgi:hypothetical protein
MRQSKTQVTRNFPRSDPALIAENSPAFDQKQNDSFMRAVKAMRNPRRSRGHVPVSPHGKMLPKAK